MTDQELNDLDRLLATDVMGWREYLSFGELPAWQDQEGNHCGYVNVYDYPNPWCPTRSIEQAMMVAEKISQESFFGLERYENFDSDDNFKGKFWRAWFGKIQNYKEDRNSPALAICLAAQEWV